MIEKLDQETQIQLWEVITVQLGFDPKTNPSIPAPESKLVDLFYLDEPDQGRAVWDLLDSLELFLEFSFEGRINNLLIDFELRDLKNLTWAELVQGIKESRT